MTSDKKKNQSNIKLASQSNKFNIDTDADKTGTDINNDKTTSRSSKNKFDKPKREVNPDKTGIDINSDKTKKETK